MVNNVQLLGHYGSDEIIACSAWVSTSRELTDEKRERIPQMIQTLWKNGHHTPFEKGIVHFLIDTDIATHIHFLKHRISSLNAESARYKQLKEDRYYLPQDWKGIKPHPRHRENDEILEESYNLMFMSPDYDWINVLEAYTEIGNDLYRRCLEDLTPILGRKRAKESARYFKTYNSQIQSDVQFNMRSFANFLHLRNDDHAQDEIHMVAQEMVRLVKEIEGNPFEYTLKAWGYD